MRRARLLAVVGLGVALMLVAACSDVVEGRRTGQTAAYTQPGCPATAAQLPKEDGNHHWVGEGQLPPGFAPARVVHCVWNPYALKDETRVRVVVDESRSPVVTADLLSALDLPDQEFAPFSGTACQAIWYSPQVLVLVEAGGRAVTPWLPATPCGDLRDEVKRAMVGLGLRPHRTYKFEMDQ